MNNITRVVDPIQKKNLCIKLAKQKTKFHIKLCIITYADKSTDLLEQIIAGLILQFIAKMKIHWLNANPKIMSFNKNFNEISMRNSRGSKTPDTPNFSKYKKKKYKIVENIVKFTHQTMGDFVDQFVVIVKPILLSQLSSLLPMLSSLIPFIRISKRHEYCHVKKKIKNKKLVD